MANFISNQQSDYIFNSATLRNLPPEFVGDTHWDYALHNDRLKLYLCRNMTKVEASHRDRSLKRQTAARSEQTQPAPVSSNEIFNKNATAINGTTQVKGTSKPAATLNDAFPESATTSSIPAPMSARTAPRKRRNDWYDSKRQSLRNQNRTRHEDPDSFLIFKINNIRKKLNWKDSKTARELPPRKRPRHETVDCDISLAIWDNSGGTTSKLPLVTKREFCQSTKIKRETDHVNGEFVELKLDEPFVISQKELRVASNNSKDRMALAKEYFMEIKITPRNQRVIWPPIPMLGKSDGDRFTGMGTDAKDEINTSMIARYQHLPTAPEADTPLSIFVYTEGRTFRTKYGLEVSAKWVTKDHPDLIKKPSPEPEYEPWALDDAEHPFGRAGPNGKLVKPVSHAARKTAPTSRKSVAKSLRLPKITYSVHVSKGAKKGFNKFSIRGLKCYSCSGKSFGSLVELRFHLEQNHKISVTVENEVRDPAESRLIAATIMIEAPSNERLRATLDDDVSEARRGLIFEAPSVPFDLELHYTNQRTPWTDILPAQLSKEAAKASLTLPKASDSQSVLRREHKGHVPYQNVLPFRPQEYQRKKFPNKKLLTKHVSLENPYTSISHRPVRFDDDEDARSETDDEIDDSWFVDRHMEELDLHSWQKDWSDPRRRLAKKWDWHILHRERDITAKYIGDCLIRFVRMEKRWILRDDMRDDPTAHSKAQIEGVAALVQMMDELKNMKVINESVCSDILTILYDDDKLELPIEEQKEIEAEAKDTSKRKEKIRRHKRLAKQQHASLGPLANVCAKCHLAIGHDKQRAVRCCSLKCTTPNVWYHAKCAGLVIAGSGPSQGIGPVQAAVVSEFMKTRLTWKCDRCTTDKGKEKLIPPIPSLDEVEMINEEPMVQSPDDNEGMSEVAMEDAAKRSRSPSVVPSILLRQVQRITSKDVYAIIESERTICTAWIDDRRSLRGIVAHHFHLDNYNPDKCVYAIIDERPSRSRSKKPHTVLAIGQEYEQLGTQRQIFVKFSDDSTKRDSEHWRLSDRDFEAELFMRFRPYKVQHHFGSGMCNSKVFCTGVAKTVYLGDGRLSKEPGRGFYISEQNNPGTVWAGDYFEEIQKFSKLESETVCKEPSHHLCFHSITAEDSKYKKFAKVELVPWSAL